MASLFRETPLAMSSDSPAAVPFQPPDNQHRKLLILRFRFAILAISWLITPRLLEIFSFSQRRQSGFNDLHFLLSIYRAGYISLTTGVRVRLVMLSDLPKSWFRSYL